MKVRIHRGTKEIGGTCIELAAGGDRIALDFGLPLDGDAADSRLVPEIAGDDLRAIVITHPHIDHYGLLHHLSRVCRILCKRTIHRRRKPACP